MSTERHRSPIDWQQLIDEALTAPGQMGNIYNRFYSYSYLNLLYLRMQGVAEPVATWKRWRSLGRRVLSGSQPKEIIRPLLRQVESEDGQKVEQVYGFQPVRCIYGLSETVGKELPPVTPTSWDARKALSTLKITQVPFTLLNGNIQGGAYRREVMVSELAINPTKTLIHELAHVVLGHTLDHTPSDFAEKQPVREFQAEATAYLAMHELGVLDEESASASRAYIQSWLEEQRPPDNAIRAVFRATERILQAGRIAVGAAQDAP